MANTSTTTPSVKKYVDYAQQQIDEQAILDKYNAATLAQFNVQREQNRQAENQFYNQMYNTQRTAMDTIRQSNAAAVSSGASRGVQAANELSALLGLQTESVAGATELAQANRQTAQEETAAVLDNVLKAYQQASQERSNLVSQAIESASVDAQEAANEVAATEAQTNRMNAETNKQNAQTEVSRLLTEASQSGTAAYLTALQQAGFDYSDGVVTPASQNSLNVAISGLGAGFTGNDWAGTATGASKAEGIVANLKNILNAYGMDASAYESEMNALVEKAGRGVNWGSSDSKVDGDIFGEQWRGKSGYADYINARYNYLVQTIQQDYAEGVNRKKSKK